MADTSMALAVIPENGVDAYRMSTNAATVCGAIVKATAQTIQGKKYVRVEGWQAIAVAHGCSASSCSVEVIEGGIRATGQVRRMDTGQVIAEAEGFVGDDEKTWAGRPMFARRAMAQTRAISRACRSAFAHVVILIDKDLGTTPAEEMQGVVDYEPTHPGNAQTRSLGVAPEDQHMVQGDGRSQYQVDKEKKAVNLLKESAKLAMGLCTTKTMLLDWWSENGEALLAGLPDDDFEAIKAAVKRKRSELPELEKVA